MGIPGLMSYITKRPEFLQNYELNDTKLVIDGNNLLCHLYQKNNCNHCFGGDYEKYAYYVTEFFDELLKCKITPLIIYDGALEDKKMDTIYKRLQNKIENASKSTPTHELEVLPTLIKDIFKYIVTQKGIKSVQSIFEADDHIASIAKILKCPVLSSDSDFFIYDVLYIPLNTLETGFSRGSNSFGKIYRFVKKCKIFKTEYFLKNFNGMDKNLLPLASVLLGNDYLSSSLFNNFFCTLKISREFKIINRFKQYQRIEALFRWMQNRSLNAAISSVINTLDPDKRQSVVEVIEVIINGFLNPSSELLEPLGYSQQEIKFLMQNFSNREYKFQYIDDHSVSEHVAEDDDETDLSCTEDDNDGKTLPTAESLIFKPGNEIDINGKLPTWFLEDYHKTNLPAYYIDIINSRSIVTSQLMEDFSQPTCFNICLKIISLVFKLLHTETSNYKCLKYIARDDSMIDSIKIKTYEVNCDQYEFNFEIPSLEKLKDYPISKRKEILTATLGVNDKIIMEFPSTWRLYMSTIKFWINEADTMFTTIDHLYTLVLLIIHRVIKKVYFEKMNDGRNNNNTVLRNKQSNIQELDISMPIQSALDNVTKQDCSQALNYFELHKRVKMEETFEIAVVHSFSLLQTCIKQSINLNALLGYPYSNFNIAEFFSGTLAYNIYNDIAKQNPCYNLYIFNIFKDSPSVLQLFVSLSTKMISLVEDKRASAVVVKVEN